MFNPGGVSAAKTEKARLKKEAERVKQLALQLIPQELQVGLIINIKEVQCGDPSCAPIDTLFQLVWNNGGRGMFGIPAESKEVNEEMLLEEFPDETCLKAWYNGEEYDWPPAAEPEPLRFAIGERVECRIGPDPVTGWAKGRIVDHYYSESHWPAGAFAPYQVKLHDDRLIFAPQDTDMVIRRREKDTTAPQSPHAHEIPSPVVNQFEEDFGEDVAREQPGGVEMSEDS